MYKYSLFTLYFALCFFLSGCHSNYVSVRKVPIDKTSLASTYAETPDPKGLNPPKGEKLFVSWRLPFSIDPTGMKIKLQVIYRDLTTDEVEHPINFRLGAFGFDVLDKKFKDTKGFYSYRAELLDKDGKSVDVFKQKMWINILNLNESQPKE